MRLHAYVTVAISVCLLAPTAAETEYRYPYRDPYLATVTTAIVNADNLIPRLKREVVHIPLITGRGQLPSLEGRDEFSVTVYRQDHPAPLLFVLAGIGSNPYFGLGTYFAWLFQQQGFHVVILPSPMSWNFALSASQSGAPGYAPADARDLYEAMQQTLAVLRAQYRVTTTRIAFLGASLGALEGAYLSVLDASEQKIAIDGYLLLNPPLDLDYALHKVDLWTALPAKFGPAETETLIARALAILDSFSTDPRDDPAVFDRLTSQFSTFTREQLQFLLAKALQMALPELVYVTDVIQNRDDRPATLTEARRRIQAANRVSFLDYIERLGVPVWTRSTVGSASDLKGFARRSSLTPILDHLRDNARVHIVHNEDDVLIARQSLRELQQALGSRVTVFPYGGHLGNVWYQDNRDYALRVLGATGPSGR